MKRFTGPITLVLVVMAAAVAPVHAQDSPAPTSESSPSVRAANADKTIAIGFHSSDQPIGGRWWFQEKLALDFGLGFGADKTTVELDTNGDDVDDLRIKDTLGRWAVEIGMPYTAWGWEKVRVMLRPGLGYQSEDDLESFTTSGTRVKFNTFSVTGEIEVEVPIATRVTLSASHGIRFENSKLDVSGAESAWSLDTTGFDFTQIGFHAYLW